MKKKIVKKILCLALSAITTVSMITGCGNSGTSTVAVEEGEATTEAEAKYPEFITVDVFDGQANFQGIQAGWFGKIVKDKFNMELNIIAPNVAGGGDTLYQTRSANGNLGDLILVNTDKSRLKDLVQAELVLDMTDYMENCTYLQKYKPVMEETSKLAEKEGLWAIPNMISSEEATAPSEATDPTNAPSLRWDLYKEAGYPEINTLEDLLPILKEMQDNAEPSKSGKQPYAFSLFKDWDGDLMQNAGSFASLYGYDVMGFAMLNIDNGDAESIIDNDSQYVRGLRFLFNANQMGLVDPESTTQNFDIVNTKFSDGAVLYSLWPWLGTGAYNTAENTAEGKGFASATIKDGKYVSWGNSPVGKPDNAIMIGSKAKDPQRLADFIDWLYSPEGIMASGSQTGGACGPEGLTWEMKDGKPVLTEFGVKAFIDIDNELQVPDEWGGGTWKDGVSALNYKAVGIVDSDEETGMCYNYARWDDYIERTSTTLSKEWSEKTGYTTAIEYFDEAGLLAVVPGTTWATPEYSTDINTIKEQCKQIIVENSWKMVFAENEEEFESLLKNMQDTVIGLGYEDVLAVDLQNCEDRYALLKEVAGK